MVTRAQVVVNCIRFSAVVPLVQNQDVVNPQSGSIIVEDFEAVVSLSE